MAVVVYNHDVKGIHDRLNRFIVEMNRAASANVSAFSAHDNKRLRSYISAIRTYLDWVMSQPLLDLPESSPREYALDKEPELVVSENEAVNDIVRMLLLARDEIAASQSARMPCSLTAPDVGRFQAVIDKVELFLDKYVENHQPLDLPETAPMTTMAPAGNNDNPAPNNHSQI